MNEEMLEKFRRAGKISAEARDYGMKIIEEGVKYIEVVEAVEELIRRRGAELAFPVNVAVNSIAAHYTPAPGEKKRFQHGDLVKLDVGAHIDGCIGDTAATVEVGTSSWSGLVEASRQALYRAISFIKAGVSLGELGGVVERVIRSSGFQPIVNLTGHSIDVYKLHGGYSIPNYNNHNPLRVKEGLILAIEPFATNGGGTVASGGNSNIYRYLKTKIGLKPELQQMARSVERLRKGLPFSSRWFVKEIKGSVRDLRRMVSRGVLYSYPILVEEKGGMVSQWEHTIYVKENGVEVLTERTGAD